jgi:hypothetical protein
VSLCKARLLQHAADTWPINGTRSRDRQQSVCTTLQGRRAGRAVHVVTNVRPKCACLFKYYKENDTSVTGLHHEVFVKVATR